jgi:hypothetical protein
MYSSVLHIGCSLQVHMHSRWRADIMAAVVYRLEQWYLPHDFQGAARGAPVAEHLGSADLPWPSFAAAP